MSPAGQGSPSAAPTTTTANTTNSGSTTNAGDRTSSVIADAYDGVICDLDGVVYRGTAAVPGAPEALTRLVEAGLRVTYATNNASRVPDEVSSHLLSLGAPCTVTDVVTSSQAGAAHLATTLHSEARVLALGGPGVAAALTEAGLTPVAPSEAAAAGGDDVEAVLQGLGRHLTVTDFETAARCLASGAVWVATNSDATLPLEWGVAPGNGAYVDLLAATTGLTPEVVGKPYPPLYLLAIEHLGSTKARTLAIGDRLDTDIAGAGAAGVDCAWVLTGVDRPSSLFGAPAIAAPTHVVAELSQLLEPHAAVVPPSQDAVDAVATWTCGAAKARIDSGPRLVVEGSDGQPIDGIRAGLAALLAARDAGTHPRAALEKMARVLDDLV